MFGVLAFSSGGRRARVLPLGRRSKSASFWPTARALMRRLALRWLKLLLPLWSLVFLPHTATGCTNCSLKCAAATLHTLNHTSSSSEISLIPGKVHFDGTQKGRAPFEWLPARPDEGGCILNSQSRGFSLSTIHQLHSSQPTDYLNM